MHVEDIPGARLDEPEEQAILAPVLPGMSYEAIHHLSQSPLRGPEGGQITTIRRTATIRGGTRMIKLLSGRQLAGLPARAAAGGFCYREFDLRAAADPAELRCFRRRDLGRFGRSRLRPALARRRPRRLPHPVRAGGRRLAVVFRA